MVLVIIQEVTLLAWSEKDWEKTEVFEIDNNKFTSKRNITTELLEHIKKSYELACDWFLYC